MCSVSHSLVPNPSFLPAPRLPVLPPAPPRIRTCPSPVSLWRCSPSPKPPPFWFFSSPVPPPASPFVSRPSWLPSPFLPLLPLPSRLAPPNPFLPIRPVRSRFSVPSLVPSHPFSPPLACSAPTSVSFPLLAPVLPLPPPSLPGSSFRSPPLRPLALLLFPSFPVWSLLASPLLRPLAPLLLLLLQFKIITNTPCDAGCCGPKHACLHVNIINLKLIYFFIYLNT
jgi:hypothetical protein